jgi:uncharacterized membrane protein
MDHDGAPGQPDPGGGGGPSDTEADLERAEVDGAGTERLTFFSDAVVAIALTLLALELPTPDGFTGRELWRSLGDHGDAYLAFALSFVVIAAHWNTHHDVFPWLRRTDNRLRMLNMAWLFTIVITPFATRIVSENGEPPIGQVDTSQPQRFVMYAIVQVATDLVFVLMVWWMVRGRLMRRSTPPRVMRDGYRGSAATGLGFAVSIPLFFVWSNAWVMWIIVPPAFGVVRRTVQRRSGRAINRRRDASGR